MKTQITITLDIEHDERFPNWDIGDDSTLAESVARHVEMHLRASTLQPCTVEHVKSFAGQFCADDPSCDLLPTYISVREIPNCL